MNSNSIKSFSYRSMNFITNKFFEFSHSNFAAHLWVIISKIKNFILSWLPSPYVRTPEQQQTFDQIKKHYEDLSRASVIRPQPKEEQTFLKLNPARNFQNDSQPIQKFRLLVHQIVKISMECAQEETTHPELKKIINEIAPLAPTICDIFSESICSTIQKISFEKMIDRISDIMNKEIKVHIQAQKATESESEKLAYAVKICENYGHEEIDYRTIEEWQYNEALQFIQQITQVGKKALLKEVYASTYDLAISNGTSEMEAKREAKAACLAAKTAPSEILCQEAYLRDFYLTTFINSEGVTRSIKNISLTHGADDEGSQIQDIHKYSKDLAVALSDQLFSLFNTVLKDAILPNSFWLTYLTPQDALKASARKNEILERLIQPYVTKNILSLLQALTIPQILNEQLATKVLPVFEDQLIEQTCEYVITTNWKKLSPYFYALEIAHKSKQEEISLNISGQIKNLMIEKDSVLNQVTNSRFNKIVHGIVHNSRKSHKLIRQAILDQSGTSQFDDLIYNLYELAINCPGLPSKERASKRIKTLAYLKASILVMLPQSFRKKGQSLYGESTKERDAFYSIVTPLIDKIEKDLIRQRDNTDQVVNTAFIKEALLQFLKKDHLKTYPVNPCKDYGEMIFNLGFEFGGLAPKTKTLLDCVPGAQQYIKEKINKSVIHSIAPYRYSHKSIIKVVVRSLISKLCLENRQELDKQKIKDLFFKKKDERLAQASQDSDDEFYECVDSESTMEQEIATLASLSFGLFKQFPSAVLPMEKLQKLFGWTLEKTILGENPNTFITTLSKIQNGFFNHRLINLSRAARLSRIFIHTLKEVENLRPSTSG